MKPEVAPDHPRQRLLFFIVDEELTDELRRAIATLLEKLADSRDWLVAPPEFVSETEDPTDLAPGDVPVETTGGFLEIYTALEPWHLPRELDLQHYREVSALIEALQDFSREHDITIELELDGNFVGSLRSGEKDRTLDLGLLGEWRRGLGIA